MRGPVREPPAPSRLRLVLPARPENIALVRGAVEAAAEESGLPRALVSDLRLAVTEACTNVVRHAYAGEGDLEVVLELTDRATRMVVEDQGCGIGFSPDRAGPGLGFPLIAALVTELDIQPGQTCGSRLSMSFAAPPIEAA
ncbi:MAG TPA: ATP-binding protein [Solirubrobacteraceae bacterium]|nr:ATP-binding protein [Solirubrobacteraceae bacterium]